MNYPSVDAFWDQHTDALKRAARGGARCSTGQTGFTERSDRSPPA